jgi:hypothetical protein
LLTLKAAITGREPVSLLPPPLSPRWRTVIVTERSNPLIFSCTARSLPVFAVAVSIVTVAFPDPSLGLTISQLGIFVIIHLQLAVSETRSCTPVALEKSSDDGLTSICSLLTTTSSLASPPLSLGHPIRSKDDIKSRTPYIFLIIPYYIYYLQISIF